MNWLLVFAIVILSGIIILCSVKEKKKNVKYSYIVTAGLISLFFMMLCNMVFDSLLYFLFGFFDVKFIYIQLVVTVLGNAYYNVNSLWVEQFVSIVQEDKNR